MYFSSSLSKYFTSVPFLASVATQLMFISTVLSMNLTNTYLHHKCLVKQGFYKPGSEYEEELNYYINRINTSKFLDNGFKHITLGERPNSITIICQCRGDVNPSNCHTCYSNGIVGLRKRCPRNKGGIIWFDQCYVEITAIHLKDAKMEIDYENIFSLHNTKKVSGDAKLFNKETVILLEKLTLKANDKNNKVDNKTSLYASGEKRLGTNKKLYAMVQCTRDVHMFKRCKVCLETIIKKYFPKCCNGRQGGRVLGTSCNFRYELYPFLRTNKIV